MKKLCKIILISLLLVTLAFAAFSCKTAAIWRGQGTDTERVESDVTPVNGSAKYIIYAALNSSGNMILRPEEDDPEETVAYAVVGYTGLVAELIIPDTYDSLPVTKVLVASSYRPYYCYCNGAVYRTGDDARLANNTVVKSIVFGSNVTTIGGGVCTGMVNLEKVTFASLTSVTLGDYAFMYCTKLATVEGEYTDTSETAFLGCVYTPPVEQTVEP